MHAADRRTAPQGSPTAAAAAAQRRRPARHRARAAPARVDGDPPPRRPAAGRLPHAVARRRPRTWPTCASTSTTTTSATSTGTSRRGCRALRARVHRRPRDEPPGSCSDLEPVGRLRLGRARKRNVSAEFVAVLARLLTRHGNRVGALLYGSGVDTVIPTARRPPPRAAPAAQHAAAARHRRETGTTRLRDLLASAASADQAPLHRVRGLRLHQRARLGATRWPAGPAPRGGGRAPVRPAGAGPARPRAW